MHLRIVFLLLIAVCLIFSQTKTPIEGPPLSYEVDASWPELPAGWNFGETADVAVDKRGHVFVFHRGPHPIMEFDPHGTLVRSWGDGLFKNAHGLRIDPEGNIWAIDNGEHFVLKMNPQGRVMMLLGRRGRAGDAPDLFNAPTDVAVAPNGDFYVSDGYGNSRVVKYNKDGKVLKVWGKKGTGEGEFDLPHAVILDKRGRLYVGDRQNYRIQIFDANGNFLQQWKHVGSPWGLEITEDQQIFMADGWNDRIVKLNLDGQILGVMGKSGPLPGQFRFVHHLALGLGGELYTGEIINMRAQRFVPR